MGGRGSSSGVSVNGKPYGTEFSTLYKSGNIKFIKANVGAPTAPRETMTRGRVYVTVDDDNNPKYITYYDKSNKRVKQIDLDRPHNGVSPHTHHGYNHNENDGKKKYANLTTKEKEMVERIKRLWYNRNSK